MPLDPRLNAYREDIADARLKGQVEAGNFVDGQLRQIIDPIVTLHAEPHRDAQSTSQALYGERVTIFEDREGWAWGQLEQDGYVGYLSGGSLSADLTEPTHAVAVLSTYLYTAPGIKTQPVVAVYLNSNVSVTGTDGDFARLADGRFAWARHLRPLGDEAGDPASIAEQFQYVPYLWGGKSQAGVDCSGLVQLSYHATGRQCPRDTDMMQEAIGEPLLINGLDGLQRGDLVFWKGHIGMMLDADRLVHANGYHMSTVVEPLRDAVDRIGKLFGPVTGFRRP
ncbi:MAG: C40 family peptidase [Hyphomicrobiales bacterium]|nr:C40 family peptidase [Hyphomicrobiales bacterium]